MTYTDRSSSQSLIIFRSLQINTVSDLVSRSKTFGKKKLDEPGQGRTMYFFQYFPYRIDHICQNHFFPLLKILKFTKLAIIKNGNIL